MYQVWYYTNSKLKEKVLYLVGGTTSVPVVQYRKYSWSCQVSSTTVMVLVHTIPTSSSLGRVLLGVFGRGFHEARAVKFNKTLFGSGDASRG